MKTFKQFQEGIKTKLAIGGLMALPFAMQKIKDKFDPVGNKRKEFQQKKKEKYENNLVHKDKVISTNYETCY